MHNMERSSTEHKIQKSDAKMVKTKQEKNYVKKNKELSS